MCSRHTPKVHQKVSAGRVAICGLGGLGSNAAVYLARTGVGHLHLIDFDTVDASNLNRQSYMVRDLASAKPTPWPGRLPTSIPSSTSARIRPPHRRQRADHPERRPRSSAKPSTIPNAKTMLVHTILEQCPDKYIVSASGMAGYGDSNEIQTKKIMDRFYVCGDQTRNAKPGRGLMAPRVAICAAHEANLIIQLLVDVL